MKKILSAFAVLLALTGCNSSEPKTEATATTDGKAIVENIMTRTSIRQYTDQDISADTIETLLYGVWGAGTLHYAIAKIFGPLLFGRGWCG